MTQTTYRSQKNAFSWRKVAGKLIPVEAMLAFFFMYIPIIILIVFSFNASRFTSIWSGFTFDWYKSLFAGAGVLGLSGVTVASEKFASAGIIKAFQNSILVATISTIIATTFGTMVAMGMERLRFKWRSALDVMLYLPIVIPEITMGISLAVFFNLLFDILQSLFGIKMNFGFWTIIIGHVAFNISFVAIVVRARLAGMDRSLEEAAQDSGANEWETFKRVVFPLIMPGVLGGALLAFTLSLDDFVITFYTSGIGTSTLPLFVFGMIRFEVTPAINAISTLMLAGSIVLVLLSLLMQRR
jgi:spermidine/putrescine transport system permease protein